MSAAADKDVALPVDDEMWLRSLEKRVDDTPSSSDWHAVAKEATVFRVPGNIRVVDSQAYDPKIVSLGPYHHHDQRLRAWGHDLKWLYFKKFLSRNQSKRLGDYFHLIKKLEPQARSAYSEKLHMNHHDFVEMMLLDCCFLVELLLVQMEEKKMATTIVPEQEKKKINQVRMQDEEEGLVRGSDQQDPIISVWKWALPLLAHDLMMFENQLPLFVLRKLHEHAIPDASLKEPIQYFFHNFPLSSGINVTDTLIRNSQHLLQLLHSCIVIPAGKQGRHKYIYWDVPSARELEEARVRFKRKKKEDCSSFLDITFEGRTMEIPQLNIDDEVNSLLRNLIAFEQCYSRAGGHVTTYAWFMGRLIERDKDVTLLRRHEIVANALGCGDDVAALFNKLCKEVTVDFQNCYLGGLLKDVKKHCDYRWNRWLAWLNHTYFHNPWAVISLLAAVLLFLLAITQTVFTILH